MDKRIGFLLPLLFITSLTSCSKNTNQIEQEPYIRGTISKIDQTHDQNKILVEEDTTINFPEGGKKIMFSISDETKIYKQDSSSLSISTFDSLKVGSEVKGWTGNVIQTSYPAQGRAKQIIINSRN